MPGGRMALDLRDLMGLGMEEHGPTSRGHDRGCRASRKPGPGSFQHGRTDIAYARLPASIIGASQQFQRVEFRPEIAVFRDGLPMEGAAIQPFLEGRLIPGRDVTGIEARHPCRGLGLDGRRIGKRQDFTFVSHCAFKPSTGLLFLFGFDRWNLFGDAGIPAPLLCCPIMSPHIGPAS